MSSRRTVVRIVVGLALLCASVAVVRWDGAYPTASVRGRVVTSAGATPLQGVRVVTHAMGGDLMGNWMSTDAAGRFSSTVPLWRRVIVEIGGGCFEPVVDTIRAIGLNGDLGPIPVTRRPGGRPEEHVVCPSSEAEDSANRPIIRAVLSSAMVQTWLERWAGERAVHLATTALVWGTDLRTGTRAFRVVQPASFGVMFARDELLLDLNFRPDSDGGGCFLLRGFLADADMEPEDLVVRATPSRGEWVAHRAAQYPHCKPSTSGPAS